MPELIKKSFERPDEAMEYPRARMVLVRVGGNEVWRVIADAGWRYSESIGPHEGTNLCPAEHSLWLMISGRLAVRLSDGSTAEYGPTDVGSIPPGHEAWVVGDEPVVAVDVQAGGGEERV